MSTFGWGRILVLSLGVVALLAAGTYLFVGTNIGTDLLSSRGEERAQRVVEPTGAKEDPPKAVDNSKAEKETAKKDESEKAAKKPRKKATPEEPEQAVVPTDTTMYLTVPKMGIYDIPVVEGTTEASLSLGAGHVAGTGYPWAPGSNTYIAGHRLGYPGTASDHVFWSLPNLVAGDEVIIEDTLGQTYTYRVSEILEVAPTDLSVVSAVPGRDVISLQTCIENYGDYWTAGPNWFARYVVRADKVA